MNKKIIIAILIIAVMACLLVGCSDDKSVTIVDNGSFDAVSETTGYVLGWKKSTGSTNVTFPRNRVG